jgi:regulator of sigma E protease
MIFSVLKFLFICLEVVLLFNLLILVHELGHFLAARWRGLVVEKFAIWFGKPLWSKTMGGVEYRLGSIPAGGYVAIPQLAPMEALEGQVETDRAKLPPVKAIDKIIVAFAGPLFSFGLAFVMACLVWAVGKPESDSDSTVIGYVGPNTPAQIAGFQVGDEILKVDGEPVKHFQSGTDSVKWRIVRSEGETIPFEIRRGDQTLTINSGWTKEKTASWRRPALRQVGLSPRTPPLVGLVVRGKPFAQAGVEVGDLIQSVNGKAVSSVVDFYDIAIPAPGQPLNLVVDRAGKSIPLTVTNPSNFKKEVGPELGVMWGKIFFTHPNPWTQVSDAATSIFRMVDALLSPKSDVKAAHFSGPIGIWTMYYKVFESDYGWRLALSLSVLINVNLAMLNLLPFPVLDGGHIMLAIIEGIRRKPISIRVLEVVQTACAILLIGFMLYVTFYDVGDFIPQDKKAATEEKK